jgi:hypothetical protein
MEQQYMNDQGLRLLGAWPAPEQAQHKKQWAMLKQLGSFVFHFPWKYSSGAATVFCGLLAPYLH